MDWWVVGDVPPKTPVPVPAASVLKMCFSDAPHPTVWLIICRNGSYSPEHRCAKRKIRDASREQT